MNRFRKIVIFILSLAMCVQFAAPAYAANDRGLTYTATINTPTINVSSEDQTIVLTVKASEEFGFDSLTAEAKIPNGFSISAIENGDLNFMGNQVNAANGRIAWFWDYRDGNDLIYTDLLAVITYKVPANTPAGTYKIEFNIESITEYYAPLEDGATVTATLTIEEAEAPHEHTHNKYGSNDTQHWSVCECGQKIDGTTADHTFTNGTCVCGKVAAQYEITWVDGNGEELYTRDFQQGTVPTYQGSTPTKDATAEFTYEWDGGWDPTPYAANKNQTYTATFTETTREYAITWIVDGSESTGDFRYGIVPEYPGTLPACHTVEWEEEIVAVTGEATYHGHKVAHHVDGDDKNHDCDICDATDIEEHSWVDADCTTPKTCSECGATDGDANGHTKGEIVSYYPAPNGPTCMKSGYADIKCGVCGTTWIGLVDALDHIDANTDHKCDFDCGKTDVNMDKHIDSATDGDHVCDYGCQEVLERCSDVNDDGDHNCDVCKATGITSHTYGEATCDVAATCSECGATDGDALGHIDDNHDHKCDRNCGKNDMNMDQHVDSATDGDHVCDYGCKAVLEKCSDMEGDQDHNCDVCNEPGINGHTPGETVVENEKEADCTNEGSYDEVVYCTECNIKLSSNHITVDALGHNPGEAVKEAEQAPDCTNEGSYDEVVRCTVCNEELSRDTITVDALGHGHTQGFDYQYHGVHNTHEKICLDCGATVESKIPCEFVNHVCKDCKEPERMTVTFMNGTDEWVKTYVEYGMTLGIVGMPIPEAAEGYEFGGWYTQGGVHVAHGMTVTENLVAYATWTQKEYTITLMVDGMQYGKVLNVKYGDPIDLPTPEKADVNCTVYTFSGWNETVPATMPAENLTFTGSFSQETVHKSDKIAYEEINENTHDEHYACCGELIKANVEHKYKDHECLCGEKENIPVTIYFNGGEFNEDYREDLIEDGCIIGDDYIIVFFNYGSEDAAVVVADTVLKEGYVENGCIDEHGKVYAYDEPIPVTEPITVSLRWKCLHQNCTTTYKNITETTHDKYYSCGELIEANIPHDFNNDAHKCVCNEIQKFKITINFNGGVLNEAWREQLERDGFTIGKDYAYSYAVYNQTIYITVGERVLKDGYTENGGINVKDNTVYTLNQEVIVTEDITFDLQWKCLHETTKLVNNEDGKTHSIVCTGGCKEVITESVDHDYTHDAANHKCACGAQEHYGYTLYLNGGYVSVPMEGFTVTDEYLASPALFPHGHHIEVDDSFTQVVARPGYAMYAVKDEATGIVYKFEDKTEITVTSNLVFTAQWKCLHETTKAVDNEDGKTHSIVCTNPDCGETVRSEDHSVETGTTCSCGVVAIPVLTYDVHSDDMDYEFDGFDDVNAILYAKPDTAYSTDVELEIGSRFLITIYKANLIENGTVANRVATDELTFSADEVQMFEEGGYRVMLMPAWGLEIRMNGGTLTEETKAVLDSFGLEYDENSFDFIAPDSGFLLLSSMNTRIIREGYTLTGFKDEEGTFYSAAEEDDAHFSCAKDTYLEAVWQCDHATTKLVDNEDGKTHSIVCTNEECNGHIVTPNVPHDFENAEHKCDCGAEEKFSITLWFNGGVISDEAYEEVLGGAEGLTRYEDRLVGTEVLDFGTPFPLSMLANPNFLTKEGYNLIGAKDKDGNIYNADSWITVSGDIELTALWEAKTYTVTWTVNGEKVGETTVKYDQPITAPEYTAPAGYEFSNWDIPATMPAENLTLDATLTKYVARIDDQYFTTFDAAYTAANKNDTIVLLDNILRTTKVTIAKEITIDGGEGYSFIPDENSTWTSGTGLKKKCFPWIVITADGAALQNVTINSSNRAGGVKIEAENVVFDTVSIVGVKADTITIDGSLYLKKYLKADTYATTIDAKSGVVTAEPGTVFDMTKYSGNVVPATSDLKGVMNTDGDLFFCAYNKNTYLTILSATTFTDGLTLLKDATLPADKEINGTMGIDLNGNDLTIADGKKVTVNGALTITGEGTVSGEFVLGDVAATIAGPENMTVASGVEGYYVEYVEGVYKLSNVYTVTVITQVMGEVKLPVSAGANLLETLAQAAEDGKIPALRDRREYKTEHYNGEAVVTYYHLNEDGYGVLDESHTMPAKDIMIDQIEEIFGWYFLYEDNSYIGAEYYDETAEDYITSGWHFIEKNYDGVDGGAWYYFEEKVVNESTHNLRVEGMSRVPYPTEPIDGKTYAADAETLEYCEDQGIAFIDEDEAWFWFDEDGKFLSNATGIVPGEEVSRYATNGMLTWHPGLVEIDDEYYYFLGDEEIGGNIMATGDIYVKRNLTDRDVVINGVYTFGEDGKLCEYDGITDMPNGTKRYYEDARLMIGNGLTQVKVEGSTKYIYVRSNGELVVNGKYWVPVNTFGIVEGIYSFDENGFLTNPAPTSKNGVYFENNGWFYYVNGSIAYNKGLIVVENVAWYASEDAEGQVQTGTIYVRSNGQLAVGDYWITNVANYTGTGIAAGARVSFNEQGLMTAGKNGIVAENNTLYYYKSNIIIYNAGVIEIDGNYYYVRSNGEVVNGKSYWITNVGESGVVAKQYTFDANGVMLNPEFVKDLKNGIVNEDGVLYYYENGNRAYGAGLLKLDDGAYIYVRSNGQLATGLYWPTTTNGYDISGRIDFGTDGKYYPA